MGGRCSDPAMGIEVTLNRGSKQGSLLASSIRTWSEQTLVFSGESFRWATLLCFLLFWLFCLVLWL